MITCTQCGRVLTLADFDLTKPRGPQPCPACGSQSKSLKLEDGRTRKLEVVPDAELPVH